MMIILNQDSRLKKAMPKQATVNIIIKIINIQDKIAVEKIDNKENGNQHETKKLIYDEVLKLLPIKLQILDFVKKQNEREVKFLQIYTALSKKQFNLQDIKQIFFYSSLNKKCN